MILAKAFVLCLAVYIVNGQDFCDDKHSCDNGEKNIGCGNDGSWAASCPEEHSLIQLSQSDIDLILDEHNKLRNKIASGQESGFDPASRMTTMVRKITSWKDGKGFF